MLCKFDSERKAPRRRLRASAIKPKQRDLRVMNLSRYTLCRMHVHPKLKNATQKDRRETLGVRVEIPLIAQNMHCPGGREAILEGSIREGGCRCVGQGYRAAGSGAVGFFLDRLSKSRESLRAKRIYFRTLRGRGRCSGESGVVVCRVGNCAPRKL